MHKTTYVLWYFWRTKIEKHKLYVWAFCQIPKHIIFLIAGPVCSCPGQSKVKISTKRQTELGLLQTGQPGFQVNQGDLAVLKFT